MCGALDTVDEISRLLKYSPQRDSLFESIKSDIAPGVPGFQTLYPTRWTTKAASLQSIIDNYATFQELWVEAKDVTADSEARARIHGAEVQMMNLISCLGLYLECASCLTLIISVKPYRLQNLMQLMAKTLLS